MKERLLVAEDAELSATAVVVVVSMGELLPVEQWT